MKTMLKLCYESHAFIYSKIVNTFIVKPFNKVDEG